MKRMVVQLLEEQHKRLKNISKKENVSMSELVRRGVDREIESRELVSDEEKRMRALALVGKFDSGKGDISERHDEYLAEDFKD